MIWRTCVANVTGIGISVSLALSLFAAQPHGHAHPFLCHVFVRGGFVLVGMSVSDFTAADETNRVVREAQRADEADRLCAELRKQLTRSAHKGEAE